MSDPVQPGRHDSIAAIGSALRGSATAQRALPWLLSVLTLVGGWAAAKIDTRLDIQHEVQTQLDRRADIEAQRHQQVLAQFEQLQLQLLSQDVRDPGRVIQIEKDVWLAWRTLAELRAVALAGESARVRALKETQGARFARAFDLRASTQAARLVYAELVDQVAVP